MENSIPMEVCKLKDTIENKIEDTFRSIQRRVSQEQIRSKTLRNEVKSLLQENALLDKEIAQINERNKKLEDEIFSLKLKTQEAACSLGSIKWKIQKTELLKEFEKKNNEYTYNKIRDYEDKQKKIQLDAMEIQDITPEEKRTSLSELEEKVATLTQEIEKKKKNIKMADPKLPRNIKILEKRNAAILTRYKRQVSETQSRYRQTLLELNSLKRNLEEKKALLQEK